MHQDESARGLGALSWDPELESPATLLVIGGGPVGIEAALYARFLGYTVWIVEQGRVGSSLTGWRDAELGPWSEVCSSLGLASLEAQETLPKLTSSQATVQQYVDDYLVPVAKTDLLYDSVLFNSRLIALSRTGGAPGDPHLPSSAKRSELEFRTLIDSKKRGEFLLQTEIVLDCSGCSGRAGLASGGGHACGESLANDESDLPYTLGHIDWEKLPCELAQRHVIVFGDDLAAQKNIIGLSKHLDSSEGLKISWLVPKWVGKKSPEAQVETPMSGGASSLEGIRAQAMRLRDEAPPGLAVTEVWGVEKIERAEEQWSLTVQPNWDETLELKGHWLVNCASRVPKSSFACGLDIRPIDTEGSQAVAGQFITREPHYYLLGDRACPSQTDTFNLAGWREQIRQVFSVIGGRAALDLYGTVSPKKNPWG